MAVQIIERWHLMVLRVRLDLTERAPTVEASLVGYPDGSPKTMWIGHYPLSAFGLGAEAPPTSLTVPNHLSDAVAAILNPTDREPTLWLHLVAPYGYLGAVPWEAALIPAAGRPVLRVPDRLPVVANLGQVWRGAIAVSAPKGMRAAAPYIHSLLARLRSAMPTSTDVEVDVFADAGTAAALREAVPVGQWVRIHKSANAEKISQSRSRVRRESVRSSVRPASYEGALSGQLWADWIADGLAGQAVRALHVVLDGGFDGDRPKLIFSPDPNDPVARDKCAFVTGDAIVQLADGIGAATLSFGSPKRNPADLATRMIADSVGQQRAGATIYSSIAEDPHGDVLARALAFLADGGRNMPIPSDPSLFAYVQPEQLQPAKLTGGGPSDPSGNFDVGAYLTPASPGDDVLLGMSTLTGYRPSSSLDDIYPATPTVPTWVAVSDRYLASQWADLAKSAASPAPTAKIKAAYNQGAAEALADLQDIVFRHARPE
jgi:hypothetical protein